MKKVIKMMLALLAALVCGGAWASTNDALNYWDAKYWGTSTSGNHDLKSPNSPLVFSGINTLDELKEYYVYGTMNGEYATDISYSNYAYPVMGAENNGFETTDGGLTLQLQCVDWDGPHIKYANIKFTQGSDGIHATQLKRGYLDCVNNNKSRLSQYLKQKLGGDNKTGEYDDTDKYAIYSLHAIKKSEMVVPSATAGVISINMYQSDDNGDVTATQKTLVGDIPVGGWTQNGSKSQTTAYTGVKIYNAGTQVCSDAQGVDLTWSITGLANLGYLGNDTNDETKNADYNYMSSFFAKRDGSQADGYIKVDGVPFKRYDVILYFNGYAVKQGATGNYWASYKHNHFTLDDNTSVNYNFNGRGELSEVKATCNHTSAKNAKPEWGRSGLATPVLGLNAGIIRGRNSSSFKIAATFQGSGVAAIQIVERPVSSYTATVSEDCSFNDIEWTPSLPADLSQAKLSLTTSGNPTIDLASAVSCAEIEINGEVKFTNQNNLTTKLTIPDGSTVSFGTATTFPGTVCGKGTLKIDLGTTGDASTSDTGIAARCLTEFQGTLHIVSGRYKPNSVLNANIKIKVTHGGQFWTCAGTWNNEFELSGRGWGGTGNIVEQTALRLGGSIGETAKLKFVNDTTAANTPTAIGSTDGNLTIAGTLEGDNGFEVRGSGLISFLPTIQSSNLHGTILLTSGIKLGNNSNPDRNVAYKLGDGQIEVTSGTRLTVHYGNVIDDNYGVANKFLVGTKILLNNNSTVYVDDGAHRFSNITLKENSTATINLRWKKGWVFDQLNIPSTSTFNLDVDNGDSQNVRIAVDGGAVDGTLKVTSASTTDLRIAPMGETLANGTLQLTGTGNQCYVELRDNAKIGAVTGDKAGAVFTDGNAHTLTLSKGTTTCDLKDTATGKNTSSALSLVIDGTASVNSNLDNLSGTIIVTGNNQSFPTTFTKQITVQSGATLKLVVSYAQNLEGYTAENVTLNDGGVVEFWSEGASGLEKIDDSRVHGTTLEALETIYVAEVSGSVNISAIDNWTCQGSEIGTRALTASDTAQIMLSNDAVLTIDQDTSALALTISGSGSIAVAENVKFAIHEALDATGIDITMAAGSSMTIAHAAKLTVNGKDETAAHATLKTADAITNLAGSGLVEINGVSPSGLADAVKAALQDSNVWTGTFWLRNFDFSTNSANDAKFFAGNNYGNTGSKLRLSGVTSWNASSSQTITVPVELDNTDAQFGIKFTDGWSSNSVIFKHLSGNGLLLGQSGDATTIPIVIEEWEHFTGGVKMEAKVAVFGTTSDVPAKNNKTAGTIIIAENKTVTQTVDTIWSGTFLGSGMVVADGRAPGGTFTNTGWTGTVWVKNVQDPTLANFGNAGSKIKLTGVSHGAPNAFSITGEIELADDGETKAYTFDSWNGNNQTFNIATLTGDGTYAQRGFSWYGVPSKLMIGNAEDFRGGMIFTQPSDASQQKGGMWIVVGDTSPTLPGSDAHWHGRVYVQSGYTLGIGKSINSVTDNNYIAGTLKVWSDQAELTSSEFAEGSTIDLSEVGSMLTLSDTATGVTTVTVGDREIAVGDKLIAWNAKPENITLDLDKEGFFLRQTDEGAVVTACAAKIVSGEIEKVYNTLADAVAEATAGQEIELLTDVSDATSITLDKNIKLKVGGESAYTISTAFTGGAYTITKTGTGTLTLSGDNSGLTSGMTVSAGTLKCSSTRYAYGADENSDSAITLTVEDGATLYVNTLDDISYNLVLNGGTVVNGGSSIDFNHRQIRSITLRANSTVSGANFGFVPRSHNGGTLNLGGNTLKVQMNEGCMFGLDGMSDDDTGGTIEVVSGRLGVSSVQNSPNLAHTKVVLNGGSLNVEHSDDSLTVKELVGQANSTSIGSGKVVISKLSGVGTFSNIKFVNMAVVDVTGANIAITGTAEFSSDWRFCVSGVGSAGKAKVFSYTTAPTTMPGGIAIDQTASNNGYAYCTSDKEFWVALATEPIVTPEDAVEPTEITNVGTGIAIAPNANVKVPADTATSKIKVVYNGIDLSKAVTEGEGQHPKYVEVKINRESGAVELTTTDAAKPAETAIAMAAPTVESQDKVQFTITNPIPGLFYAVSSCDTPNGDFTSATGDQATSGAAKTVSIPMTFGENQKVKYYKVSVKATR